MMRGEIERCYECGGMLGHTNEYDVALCRCFSGKRAKLRGRARLPNTAGQDDDHPDRIDDVRKLPFTL